jgi:hypothetical protein
MIEAFNEDTESGLQTCLYFKTRRNTAGLFISLTGLTSVSPAGHLPILLAERGRSKHNKKTRQQLTGFFLNKTYD